MEECPPSGWMDGWIGAGGRGMEKAGGEGGGSGRRVSERGEWGASAKPNFRALTKINQR